MNFNNQQLIAAGFLVFTTGVAIGLGVGRALAFRKLDAEYDERLALETQRIDQFHRMMRKEPPFDNIRTAAAAYEERLRELDAHLDGTEYEEVVEALGYAVETVLEVEEISVADVLDPAETAVDEMAQLLRISPRDEGLPYIVTTQEFFDEHEDYDTHSVTYYEDDRMLVDDRGTIIFDIEGNLGPDYNLAFGLGSGEPHVVYIRNEQRTNDYEVLLEPGSYTENVLGVVPDEHKPPRRKMRDSDD